MWAETWEDVQTGTGDLFKGAAASCGAACQRSLRSAPTRPAAAKKRAGCRSLLVFGHGAPVTRCCREPRQQPRQQPQLPEVSVSPGVCGSPPTRPAAANDRAEAEPARAAEIARGFWVPSGLWARRPRDPLLPKTMPAAETTTAFCRRCPRDPLRPRTAPVPALPEVSALFEASGRGARVTRCCRRQRQQPRLSLAPLPGTGETPLPKTAPTAEGAAARCLALECGIGRGRCGGLTACG